MTALLMQFAQPRRPLEIAMSVSRGLLFTFFVAMLIAALHPDVRSQVRGSLVKDFRTVVSTVRGDLIGNGSELVIAKVKTRDHLLLEIYQSSANGMQRLLERIEMPDSRDGFFNFNGQATNLAIDDIDGDGRLEVLAPSFDQNLVGRLNVYNYNAELKGFERIIR